MLPTISSLFIESLKVYISSLKKFIPYLVIVFILIILGIFSKLSSPLLYFLIPSIFVRAIIYFISSLLFSLASFVLSLAIIRVVGNKYLDQAQPKFFKNIKQSFVLVIKNWFTFILLSIPAIILYVFYLFGIMGYISFIFILIGLWLIITLGILFFLWLSFVLVTLVFEEKKGWSAIYNSISLVKNRIWSVFVRLFLPTFLVYIVLNIFSQLLSLVFGENSIIYILVILFMSLVLTPFGAVVPTILYLDLKRFSLVEESVVENIDPTNN